MIVLKDGFFVGIDVGGPKKGFHAVVIKDHIIVDKFHSHCEKKISSWCLNFKPKSIAIDSPCGWSNDRLSREAERLLSVNGKKIPCFSTPTKKISLTKNYYSWINNGEKLYNAFRNKHYFPIETYPYGIVRTFLESFNVSKITLRKKILGLFNINFTELKIIDEYDAALCAITANYYYHNNIISFGNNDEGYIFLPLPK